MGARAVRGIAADVRRQIDRPAFSPLPQTWDPNQITAAWLGHSTVLLNFYGVKILTDPALFPRIGPDTPLGIIGPKRLVGPALKPHQLPAIDLVLISHAHLDHLDEATLRALPGAPRVVTAHDTADLLERTNLKQPVSLPWGEKARIKTTSGQVEITAFEVKHWGARWRYDKYRGYNGYIIAREGKRILFGGDTAWSASFRSLRSHGPFAFAMMPIGAYMPWIMSHCSPEQAVEMTNDAGADKLLPIHFKTFAFGREGTVEPLRRLEAAIEPERIGWRFIGETFQTS